LTLYLSISCFFTWAIKIKISRNSYSWGEKKNAQAILQYYLSTPYHQALGKLGRAINNNTYLFIFKLAL
jgi:hypothetical protein